ncbi:MAG: hypothetical protein IPM21_11485 [Acidobacteria bacterium]|nr:hypothetical protein [Acidobacteriota bacterium]
MQQFSIFLGRVAAVFIIIIFGNWIIAAQENVTGSWTAKVKDAASGKIHLSFERKSERGGKHQNGSTYEISELNGLSSGSFQSGSVSFSLVREAGTIQCEGTFTDGKGSGTYRFSPNYGFADGLRARGFEVDSDGNSTHRSSLKERLFMAAMLNVTTALADDLAAANFGKLGLDDLFKAAIFKIDGKFMAEMKATGFPNLSMEDLVKARIFKIDAEFVRGIKDMGFGADNFEHLVKYSIFKVTPEYLNSLRNEGLTNLDPEEVVKLRIFKVDAEFVRKARTENPNISVGDIVNKKIGVWVR